MKNYEKLLLCIIAVPLMAIKAQAFQVITLGVNPSWGTCVPPSSGTGTFTLSATTGMVTASGGNSFAFNDGGAGLYTVVGIPLKPASCSASIGSFSNPGITVVQTYLNGTSNVIAGVLSNLGVFIINVGGVLSISSAATGGTYSATVTITVNYN